MNTLLERRTFEFLPKGGTKKIYSSIIKDGGWLVTDKAAALKAKAMLVEELERVDIRFENQIRSAVDKVKQRMSDVEQPEAEGRPQQQQQLTTKQLLVDLSLNYPEVKNLIVEMLELKQENRKLKAEADAEAAENRKLTEQQQQQQLLQQQMATATALRIRELELERDSWKDRAEQCEASISSASQQQSEPLSQSPTEPRPESDSQPFHKRAPEDNPRYKTELCSFFLAGHCRYGNSCTFAHGERELITHEELHDVVEPDEWINPDDEIVLAENRICNLTLDLEDADAKAAEADAEAAELAAQLQEHYAIHVAMKETLTTPPAPPVAAPPEPELESSESPPAFFPFHEALHTVIKAVQSKRNWNCIRLAEAMTTHNLAQFAITPQQVRNWRANRNPGPTAVIHTNEEKCERMSIVRRILKDLFYEQ